MAVASVTAAMVFLWLDDFMKNGAVSGLNGLGLRALYELIISHQVQWMLADVIIRKKSSSVDHRNTSFREIKRYHFT